jgi:hypothetical protein
LARLAGLAKEPLSILRGAHFMHRSILISVAMVALALPVALGASPAQPGAEPAPSASPSISPEEQRAALNTEQAHKAQQQVDENVARELNNRDAAKNASERQREFQEASQRYEAARAQHDAQVTRYQADYAKWQADVAACQAGDKTRCAKQP